jgi:hypothetical protein
MKRGTATAYLIELADALHAHSAAAAAAEKVYAHGLADGSANASGIRYSTLNAASNAYTTGSNAARAAWSTGLADAQVQLWNGTKRWDFWVPSETSFLPCLTTHNYRYTTIFPRTTFASMQGFGRSAAERGTIWAVDAEIRS